MDEDDPIVEEIRAIRRALAAKFDNDVSAIFADLRAREAMSGRRYVTLPPRRPKGSASSSESGASHGDDSSAPPPPHASGD